MSVSKFNITKPLVYSSRVMSFKFIIVAWLIEFLTSVFLFIHFDRPRIAWYERFLPVTTIFLALFLLVFVLTNMIHYFILETFGLDASQNTLNLAIKNLDPRYSHPKLLELFPSDKEFSVLQSNIFDKISNKRRELIAICFGILLITTVHVTDKAGGIVTGLGSEPYEVRATNLPMLLISIIQITVQSIVAIGALSGFLLILEIIWALSNLTNIDNIIPDISKYIENQEDNTRIGYVEGQFSLSTFRKASNVIPENLLPINLVILGIVLLSGSGVFYMLLISEGPKSFTYLTVIVILIFVILDIFLFLYPQVAFHRIMADSKSNMITTLQTARELKKVKLINEGSTLSLDAKQELWVEIKFFTFLEEELDDFVPWPFNYQQLSTLIISSIGIAFLTINIFGFLELASRLFTP